MMKTRTRAIAAVLALCGLPAPALANDYLYKGDCERAALVRDDRAMGKLLPYKNYRGVQLAKINNEKCGRNSIFTRNLTLISINKSSATFRNEEYLIANGRTTGECADPESFGLIGNGFFEIKIQMKKSGVVCEVYLQFDRRMKLAKDGKDFITTGRLMPLSDGTFVEAVAGSNSTGYITPSAYVGF